MATIFAPPAPPTEAQRRRLYHLNSPQPSGYGSATPWSEESEKKRGVFKPVANIVSLRSKSSENLGSLLPEQDSTISMSSVDREAEDVSSGLSFGMPSPMTGHGPTNSLFPVFPTFDNSPKYGQKWADQNKQKWADQNKRISKSGGGVWDDLLHMEAPVLNKSPCPSYRSKASVSPKKSMEPPVPRRYRSIPRIHLNFNTEEMNPSIIDEMNTSIDDAIGSANMPLFQKPKRLPKLTSRPRVLAELGQPRAAVAGAKRGRPALMDAEQIDEHQKESKAFACDGCRISKTKCQGGFPCNRCERLGKECTRSPRAKKNSEQEERASSGRAEEAASDPKPAHKPCYRNAWCIRPYRHPGHCRHIKMKSRARSNKKQRLA